MKAIDPTRGPDLAALLRGVRGQFLNTVPVPFRVMDMWIGDVATARDEFFAALNMPGAQE